jgi:DNA primase
LANEFFSDETVSEVRERANILEVVSDYVSIKKTGRNHKGLCPFHSEKTPSFMVNEEKQIFHCFGCGEGGDVFTFLMKVGHFSFPEAVEALAKRYGIRISPREVSPEKKKEVAKREILFQINQVASDYFHDRLLRHREGEAGRAYFVQRGMSKEFLEGYRLGYAPDRWDGLVQHLQERKLPLEMAREVGLLFPKKKEGWYDVFRGRIIFPIFDIHQRVVGFGGRVIKEGQPKYINSSESIIYHKGEVLYGLQVAKQSIGEKDSVIIAEGYFDLLTLHQYGFTNSVATLGTALTTQHIRTLKRYTKNVITLFDGDEAGIHANLRTLPLFLAEEVWPKTVALPKDEDPDGFLRKGNRDELERKVAEAVPLFDFFLESLRKTYDVKSIDGKVKMAEEALALIRGIPEGIRRNFYVKTLAEKVDIQESMVYDMLQSAPKDRPKGREEAKPPAEKKTFPRSEEMVVRLMVQHSHLIPKISREGIIREFESPFLKKMAESLDASYQRKGKLDLGEALGRVEEDLKGGVCAFVFQESGLEGGDLEKVAEDCFQKIREGRLKKEKQELLKRIKEAEKRKGEKGLEVLLLEWQELVKRESRLRKGNPQNGRGVK